MRLPAPQRGALHYLTVFGHMSEGSGYSISTMRALRNLGLVDLEVSYWSSTGRPVKRPAWVAKLSQPLSYNDIENYDTKVGVTQ